VGCDARRADEFIASAVETLGADGAVDSYDGGVRTVLAVFKPRRNDGGDEGRPYLVKVTADPTGSVSGVVRLMISR
jgi:hypothetical protein